MDARTLEPDKNKNSRSSILSEVIYVHNFPACMSSHCPGARIGGPWGLRWKYYRGAVRVLRMLGLFASSVLGSSSVRPGKSFECSANLPSSNVQ
ncbi:hypothetical protein ACEPAG_276 [Sanghuangporus baumii]